MRTVSDTLIPRLLGRGMSMSDQLARHARISGGEVAFVSGSARVTYRGIDERVSRLANVLRERGVRPGDRVALFALNSLEVFEAYFAIARLGAVSVPLNFRLAAAEVSYVLTDCGASAAVVHGPLAETMRKALKVTGYSVPCLVFGGEMDGAADYEQSLRHAAPEFDEFDLDEHQPAVIMYTSGTTGRPKGAVLTHHNLMMHACTDLVTRGTTPQLRVSMGATPLFHTSGLGTALTTLLVGGRTVLMPSGQFDPVAVVDLFERERVSTCFLVPTQWQAVCDVPGIGDRDLSALREIGWGAAPATTTLLRKMIETFPQADVTTVYGQTECGGILTLLRGQDAVRKIGSVGTPILNVEVRVVDDLMNDVPPGEIGECVYRSPMVITEYWNKPAETAEAFAGGWFHSGDLVQQDEEGYFYVVDRKKDMIISGGENIYCAEVEDVLAAHPKVAEVAVIGVPDEKWGEATVAVIMPHAPGDPPSAAELTEWCTDRLARYKRPRGIAIVSALPRNASGKVLKTRLRADCAAAALEIQLA